MRRNSGQVNFAVSRPDGRVRFNSKRIHCHRRGCGHTYRAEMGGSGM